jgi:hypothetical protein
MGVCGDGAFVGMPGRHAVADCAASRGEHIPAAAKHRGRRGEFLKEVRGAAFSLRDNPFFLLRFPLEGTATVVLAERASGGSLR